MCGGGKGEGVRERERGSPLLGSILTATKRTVSMFTRMVIVNLSSIMPSADTCTILMLAPPINQIIKNN